MSRRDAHGRGVTLPGFPANHEHDGQVMTGVQRHDRDLILRSWRRRRCRRTPPHGGQSVLLGGTVPDSAIGDTRGR
jgi:hypothetical protein